MSLSNLKVLIRGGGELASAVACRLAECHFRIVMTETSNPEAVRRHVAAGGRKSGAVSVG